MEKIKNYFLRMKYFVQRVYRHTLRYEKQEKLVWKDLKFLHKDAEWRSGIYEQEKTIETVFEIAPEKAGIFYYMIYEGCYHCRVKILENFPNEFTSELFILAAHFNNLLKNGVVIVNVHSQYVEYHQKKDILIPLLYSSEIYGQLMQHFNVSKDIYAAFQRLVVEQEAPAIIIADLLKEKKENEDEDEKEG